VLAGATTTTTTDSLVSEHRYIQGRRKLNRIVKFNGPTSTVITTKCIVISNIL